jgi:hypothetical protein
MIVAREQRSKANGQQNYRPDNTTLVLILSRRMNRRFAANERLCRRWNPESGFANQGRP